VFTKQQQIKGVEKALASRKTPAHLKPALRKRLAKLRAKQ